MAQFNVGDHVGIGVYVDSCKACEYCNERREIYCEKGLVPTFNGLDKDGTVTKGGYSSYIVVHERYIFLHSWYSLYPSADNYDKLNSQEPKNWYYFNFNTDDQHSHASSTSVPVHTYSEL